MDRQEGYYWVKKRNKTKHEVAKWVHDTFFKDNGYWTLIYDEGDYEDGYFEHINEVRIKEPGELPEF
jgi:hypothetical protein